MQMESNSGPIESNVETNPVFIPKRMQTQRKDSFVSNGYDNKFRHKEISVNGSALPNSFRTKSIKSLKRQSIHTIPVKAEIHQQIEDKTITANGLPVITKTDENNEKFKTMTAIKGILKSKPSESAVDSAVDTAVSGVEANHHIHHQSHYNSHTERKSVAHKTQNPNPDHTKKFWPTPSERRKSSSVQFDIHDIKESTVRVELNANPVSCDHCLRAVIRNRCSLYWSLYWLPSVSHLPLNKFCSQFVNQC